MGTTALLCLMCTRSGLPRPQDMARERDERLHRANMEAFEYILELSKEPTVWAAWGNIIEMRPYLKSCVQDMIAAGERHGAGGSRQGSAR